MLNFLMLRPQVPACFGFTIVILPPGGEAVVCGLRLRPVVLTVFNSIKYYASDIK